VKTSKEYVAEIGQPISIRVPAAACHFFEPTTGLRLGDSR
jgi:hypothetical protein